LDNLQNCYRYLLAKRAASCEYEQNQAKISQSSFSQSQGYSQLQQALLSNHQSLFELEQQLVDRIASGRF